MKARPPGSSTAPLSAMSMASICRWSSRGNRAGLSLCSTGRHEAGAGLVAFGASLISPMQEKQRVAFEMRDRQPHQIARSHQPPLRMADTTFALQALAAQPVIGERETHAAMIVLAIVDANPSAVLENSAVARR